MAYTKGTLAGDFIDGIRAELNGVIAVGVVDMHAELQMDTFSARPDFDSDVASANIVEMIMTQERTIKALRLKETVKDIYITLDTQVHFLTLSKTGKAMYYVVVDAIGANLGILRSVVRKYAKGL